MVLSELRCVGTMETSFWASVGCVKESKGNEVPALPSGTGTLNVRLVFVLLLPSLGWFGHPRHPLSAPPTPCVPHSPTGTGADTSSQLCRGRSLAPTLTCASSAPPALTPVDLTHLSILASNRAA